MKEAKDADLIPKVLEEWLEAAEVEILPDHILQPDVDKSLFEAITCREDLPHDIYAPYFIRFWLGIDESSRNCEDLEVENTIDTTCIILHLHFGNHLGYHVICACTSHAVVSEIIWIIAYKSHKV